MAKPLIVEFQGETVSLQLEKVDRTKLYGYVETLVSDADGKRCELGTLAADGHSIVGRGGTASAYLSPDGLWRTKGELKPVNVTGEEVTPVRSTFDEVVPLARMATIDEFLSHNITTLYQLEPDERHEKFLAELDAGGIFMFPFSYRGGLEPSVGFLLKGGHDGHLFLCVGGKTQLEFIGLKTTAPAAPPEEKAAEDDDDGLDFGMM